MTYEELLIEAENNGLIVREKPLRAYKGRIKGNRVAIKMGLSNADKRCTLIEELGHHHKTVGNILDQSKVENIKQEKLARAWGYEKLVELPDIINAKKEGIRNRYELAEHFGVTEEFLISALNYYKNKHGRMCLVGDYIIEFEPLEVYERVDFDPDSKR